MFLVFFILLILLSLLSLGIAAIRGVHELFVDFEDVLANHESFLLIFGSAWMWHPRLLLLDVLLGLLPLDVLHSFLSSWLKGSIGQHPLAGLRSSVPAILMIEILMKRFWVVKRGRL